MNNEELLNKIVQLMQSDDAADAPADAIEWSKNLFRTRAAAKAPQQSLARRVLAVLQMDLSPNTAAFGERSASASSEARQMLFAAGDAQIDLRIVKAKKGFKVNGQLLGEDFAGAEIRLISVEQNFSAKSNELSEFRFENIKKGTYNLSISTSNQEIIIENIEIG